ncbi:hypothetical protein PWT90_10386 [Aphanocladium album]|nr:hypothetical protein PWT90_10386 [Aphanocladium album]
MKVAIVAVGALARYLAEALIAADHEVVAVSRSKKAWLDDLGIAQRTTDYSVGSLTALLDDCDAAICTLVGGVPDYVAIHKAILAACAATPRCNRFIPSLWAGNLEDFPAEQLEWSDEQVPVIEALRAQSDVKWTGICVGWFADYILPSSQRYLADIDDIWPQGHKDKIFTLYGLGSQRVNFTAARDVAAAVARLLTQDADAWDEFIYVSGEQISWADLWAFTKAQDPAWQVKRKGLSESVKQYAANKDDWSRIVALFEILGHSEAIHFPQERVERHRSKYFEGLKFRTLSELAADAKTKPDIVV